MEWSERIVRRRKSRQASPTLYILSSSYTYTLSYWLTVAEGYIALSVNPTDSFHDSFLSPGTHNTHPQSSFSNQIDAAASKVRQKICRLLSAL